MIYDIVMRLKKFFSCKVIITALYLIIALHLTTAQPSYRVLDIGKHAYMHSFSNNYALISKDNFLVVYNKKGIFQEYKWEGGYDDRYGVTA